MNGKRYAVVGVGPVGGIMAAHLAGAGHQVFLVDVLKNHLEAIRKNGLSVTGTKEMSAQFPEENLCHSIDEMEGKEIDVVFISVKASILPKIVPMLREVSKPGMTLVSLQNGIDTEDFIADAFGKESTLRIVINYAGNIVDNGKIRFSFFNPPNYLGMIHPDAEKVARELAGLITASGLDTSFTDDIKRYEWIKAILNAALSPVCALTRRTMKQMMDQKDTRRLAREILREGKEVAEACGINLEPDLIEKGVGYLDKTGHHKTSMHVDLELGNPTEIDFINGKIVEYGRLKGVPTPYNSAIVALIKGSELPLHKE
jgi:2-dehydropantoate 2-reductase